MEKQKTEEGRGQSQVGSQASQQRQEGRHFLPCRRWLSGTRVLPDHLWGVAWESPSGLSGTLHLVSYVPWGVVEEGGRAVREPLSP